MNKFNEFLDSKLNPIDTAAPAKIVSLVFNPDGYIQYFGKNPSVLIELESRLPRRVDDFSPFFDEESKTAVERCKTAYGRDFVRASYLVWL